MTNPSDPPTGASSSGKSGPHSEDPRAAALRANLAKRKGQAGARRGGKAVGKKEPSAFDRLQEDAPSKG